MNWRLADQGDFMGVFRRMFALPLLALFASLLAAAALAQGTPATPPTPAAVTSPTPTSTAAPVAATTPAAPTTPAPAAATTPAPAKPAPAPRIEFNHNQTGFQLTGGHILARCETCHLQGIFKGTPKDCGSCHTAGGRAATLNTVLKPTNHISVTSGSLCETCHLSTSEFTVWRMDHTLTTAACSSCHSGQSFGGVTFTAKGSQHIFTMADCKICHTSTTSFLPPFVSRYDHIEIAPGDCLRCHNGATAMGKPPAHMPVGARVCDECHLMPPSGDLITTFATWRMDHAGIINGCASCHSGRTYAGVKNSTPKAKPTNHIPVTSDCSVCHYDTTVPGGFVNWSQPMDHSTAAIGTASCATCHGAGKNFIGSPIVVTLPTAAKAHIPTTAACDTCHYKTHVQPYTSFTNWTMSHTGITSGCQSCHGSTQSGDLFAGVISQNPGHVNTSAAGTGALNKPDCSTCHPSTDIGGFAQFKSGIGFIGNPHGNIPGSFIFLGVTSCKACHNGTAAPGMVAGHIPVNGNAECSDCHGNGSSLQSSSFFKPTLSPAEHGSVSSTCATCHLSGKSYPGLNPPIKTQASVNHIPISSGASCTACHDANNFTSFGGRTWLANMMDHSSVSTTSCNQCHAKPANSSFTSTPALTIKTLPTQAYGPNSSAHIPVTGDCAACHNSGNYAAGGFTQTWNALNMNHGAVNTGTCSGCHAKSAPDYNFASAINVVGAMTTSYSGAGVTFPWHTLTGNAPTTDCNSCHGDTTNFGGATNAHRHVASETGQCLTCHNGAGGGKTKITNHILTSASCDACHTTWNTPASLSNETGVFAACSTNPKSCMGVAGHNQVSATCSNCHLSAGNQTITGGATSVTVVGQASGHIPVVNNSACDTCHGKVYTSFARADWKTAMNHSASVITPVRCDVCHSAGADKTYPTGVKVLGALTTPPPPGTSAYHTLSGNAPTADCSDCHGYTTTFGGAVGHTHVAGDAGKCNTCHTGTGGGMTKITNHIATTSASCDVCHTTWGSALPSVTGKFAACSSNANGCMGATGHAAVTGTCNSCHLASGVKSITGGSAAVAIKSVGSVNHIPVVASAACETCHGTVYTSFARSDWSTQMKHTSAVVSLSSCNACHASSVSTTFTGLSSGIRTTPSPAGVGGHIPITGDCVDCHKLGIYTTSGFTQAWPATSMNHNAVSTGTCSGCHPASAAYNTYQTGVNVVGALITSYSGAGVTFPWHTNGNAPGSNDCYGCHTSFTTFGGATNHVHGTGDSGKCNSCHSGTGGGGKTKIANHITTSAQCDVCHTYNPLTFSVWTMNHTGVASTANCNSCHNGQTFGATSGGTYDKVPKNKSNTGGLPHITTSLQCDACHSGTATFANGTMTATNHTNNLPATACATCHSGNVLGSTGNLAAKFKPTGHITTSQACDLCHKDLTKTTFAGQNAGWVMSHTGNSLPCSSCHNGQAFTSTTGGKYDRNPRNTTNGMTGGLTHIPLTSGIPTECTSCHSSTTAFSTEAMSHGSFTSSKTTAPASGCARCHSDNLASNVQTGAKMLASQKKGKVTLGSHEGSKTTQDCVACHTMVFTKWNSP